jgi:hypothetical protein
MISNPVVSELTLPTVRTRRCCFPTINSGRDKGFRGVLGIMTMLAEMI